VARYIPLLLSQLLLPPRDPLLHLLLLLAAGK
jgi:hypothetical protein